MWSCRVIPIISRAFLDRERDIVVKKREIFALEPLFLRLFVQAVVSFAQVVAEDELLRLVCELVALELNVWLAREAHKVLIMTLDQPSGLG